MAVGVGGGFSVIVVVGDGLDVTVAVGVGGGFFVIVVGGGVGDGVDVAGGGIDEGVDVAGNFVSEAVSVGSVVGVGSEAGEPESGVIVGEGSTLSSIVCCLATVVGELVKWSSA